MLHSVQWQILYHIHFMKLFFLNNDTLYKLFTTIEKVPKHTSIKIFIESENQFFRNPRRAKQIKQLLEERSLEATFVTESIAQKSYFEKNWLSYELRQQHMWRKILNISYWFFFNIKKFHLYIYQKKNYTFFAVFGAEMIFLCVILYLLYSLILPKTTIIIRPAHQINEVAYNFRYITPENIPNYPYPESHIIIPLQYQSATITKKLSIDGEQIKFITNPSQWQVRIVNTTNEAVKLIKNTQLITDDGILFTINDRVNIPAAWGDGKAGYAYVNATSKSEDDKGIAIGTRGNIAQWTQLIIKNLKQSKYTKSIYAEAVTSFHWWSLSKSWTIVASDIGVLQKKIFELIAKDKYGQAKKSASQQKIIILPFEELFTISGCNYEWPNNTDKLEKLTMLSGSLSCILNYPYLYLADINKWVQRYLEQRSSQVHNLVSISTESINFAQLMTGEYGSYIIPTKINTIQWYDFEKDINHIKNSIIESIAGISKEEAKKLILWYPEINNVTIKISPPRYNLISTLKSRLFIKTELQ